VPDELICTHENTRSYTMSESEITSGWRAGIKSLSLWSYLAISWHLKGKVVC